MEQVSIARNQGAHRFQLVTPDCVGRILPVSSQPGRNCRPRNRVRRLGLFHLDPKRKKVDALKRFEGLIDGSGATLSGPSLWLLHSSATACCLERPPLPASKVFCGRLRIPDRNHLSCQLRGTDGSFEIKKRGQSSPDRAEALVLAYVQVIPREQTVTFGGSYSISPI